MIRTAFRLAAPVIGLLACSSLAYAQSSDADLALRIDQLENQVRQLTGSVEQLQYNNQQLQQALQKMQADTESRFQELGSKGGRGAPPARAAQAQAMPQAAPQAQYQPPPYQAPQYQAPQYQAPQYQSSQYPSSQYPSPPPSQQQMAVGGGRRSDAFDPAQNPGAPGAPRTLGQLSSAAEPPPAVNEAPLGSPGGRPAGAPLDLTTLANNSPSNNAPGNPGLGAPGVAPSPDGGTLPPPPPRNPSGTGAQLATLPPSQSPRDEYDLAYGYMLRKDYALAEQAFRAFLASHPKDRMAPDAQYWLGESFFQRQNFREAADAFLTMSKKYESSPKAAEGLLRLGQSLAALHQKELACATYGEVLRKYPRASTTIRQAIQREQKRVRC